MQKIDELMRALKTILKANGLTYSEIAKSMAVSEASVKRWFSQGGISLQQFTEVMQLAGTEIQDLASVMKAESQLKEYIYSIEQELFFVDHPQCHAFFNALLRFGSVKGIQQKTKISSASANRYLVELERLKLVERLPADRLRFLTPKRVVWRKDGPLRKQFLREAKEEFLDATFTDKLAAFRFVQVSLSNHSASAFLTQLSKGVDEATRTAEIEKSISSNLSEYGILIAIRPWQFSKLVDL